MPKCKVWDFQPLPSSREITPEGFLVAPAKIAGVGNVQEYEARELGLDGGSKTIRLWRPPEEVAKSVKTFESVTLTDEHPPAGVNADNWKQLAVGDIRDVWVEGPHVVARVMVRDAEMRETVRGGKAALSCGYVFDLDMTPGKTPDGRTYDGIQRNIEGNHLAIVDAGRAGPAVRIGDRAPKERTMKVQRLTIGDTKISDKLVVPGFEMEIDLDSATHAADKAKFDLHAHGIQAAKDAYDNLAKQHDQLKEHAQALQDHLDSMGEDAENDGDEDDVSMTAQEEGDDELHPDQGEAEGDDKRSGKDAKKTRRKGFTKDGKPGLRVRLARALDREKRLIEAASPAAIEKLAAERTKVVGDAGALLGEEFDHAGKTVHQIRLAALDAARKDDGLKTIVAIQIGETALDKVKAGDAKRAFETVVAHMGAGGSDDRQDEELSRHIAGDGSGASGGGKPAARGRYGRDNYMARIAADSRRRGPAKDEGHAS